MAICAIPTISLIGDVLDNEYEVHIEREASSVVEREALKSVEEEDLAELTNIYRFYMWNEPCNGEAPEDIKAYVWARVVDIRTLEYYTGKVEDLEANLVDVEAHLDYHAECIELDEMEFFINSDGTEDKEMYQLIRRGFKYWFNADHAYINLSGLNPRDGWYLLKPAIMVQQHFYYSETYGNLAAFDISIHQIALLDEDLNIRVLVIQEGGGIY